MYYIMSILIFIKLYKMIRVLIDKYPKIPILIQLNNKKYVLYFLSKKSGAFKELFF